MSGGGACWRADDADGRQQLEFSRMFESSTEEEKGKNSAAGEAWRTDCRFTVSRLRTSLQSYIKLKEILCKYEKIKKSKQPSNKSVSSLIKHKQHDDQKRWDNMRNEGKGGETNRKNIDDQ